MTFSVIVPVYNVEKYLAKCLDSLLAQSFSDYEIIVVNDGSPDNSQSIIDSYVAKYSDKVKGYLKHNEGVSSARNYGIARAIGDYLVFVDSDDYVAEDMLQKLKAVIDEEEPDVLGFNFVTVDESGEQIAQCSRPEIRNCSGADAIIALVNSREMFEVVWGFTFRREFWNEKNFSFIEGIYHEDFALIPYVIMQAEKFSYIEYNAYFYLIRQGSITNVKTVEHRRKLCRGMLAGFDFLLSQLQIHPLENEYAATLYISYIANALIIRLDGLDGEAKRWYRKELKERNISSYLASDTLKRRIKKTYIKLTLGI